MELNNTSSALPFAVILPDHRRARLGLYFSFMMMMMMMMM